MRGKVDVTFYLVLHIFIPLLLRFHCICIHENVYIQVIFLSRKPSNTKHCCVNIVPINDYLKNGQNYCHLKMFLHCNLKLHLEKGCNINDNTVLCYIQPHCVCFLWVYISYINSRLNNAV